MHIIKVRHFAHRRSVYLIDWLIERLNVPWLIYWQVDRSPCRSISRWIDGSCRWSIPIRLIEIDRIYRLIGRDRVIDRSSDRPIDRFIDWLVAISGDRFIDRSINIDWSIGFANSLIHYVIKFECCCRRRRNLCLKTTLKYLAYIYIYYIYIYIYTYIYIYCWLWDGQWRKLIEIDSKTISRHAHPPA